MNLRPDDPSTATDALDVEGVSSEPAPFVEPGAVPGSRALLSNAIAGLRLLTFRKVDASSFVPSARQVLLFTLIAALIWIAYDRLDAGQRVFFFAEYALAQLGWLALVAFALFALLRQPVSAWRSWAALRLPPPACCRCSRSWRWRPITPCADTPLARWVGLLIAIVAAIYLVSGLNTARATRLRSAPWLAPWR